MKVIGKLLLEEGELQSLKETGNLYYTVVEEPELQSLKETGNLLRCRIYTVEYVTYFGEQIVG